MQAVIFMMMLVSSSSTAVERKVTVQDFEKDAKNRPVSKVIALLKDMINQLGKEGEEDEEVYETMGCWCVTNEKAKTKSIADGETAVETLTASIESLTAQSGKLNTEIANLEAEIKKNEEALATATSVREKELAEFTQEEKETLVTVNQLKAAVIALSKAHDAALLKKKSKLGTIDAKKLDAADSTNVDGTKQGIGTLRLDKKYVADIEGGAKQAQDAAEALKAEMERMTYASFLQTSRRPLDKWLKSSDDDVSVQYVPPNHAICKICPACALCNPASASRIHAEALQVHIPGDTDEHPVHKRFKAPKVPARIQAFLSNFQNDGVDTALLESGMDDSESETETGNSQYEPASGAIFGVLKQMKENFEIELSQAQQAEAKSADEFDQMKAAKETEIKTSTDLVNTKTDELATTDEKNAEDKEILEDTEATLAADKAFLADLKERCASMDAQFAERQKGRQLEIEAVSKALAFLNSDEAHDLFTRSFNPSLLQVHKMQAQRRMAVAKMLKTTALQAKDVRLLQLASEVNKDLKGLDKVKNEVVEMVDMLEKQMKDEVKKRDYCVDALNTNERDTEEKEHDRDVLMAQIEDLKMTIETLDKDIELLKAEVAELNVQLKRASDNRKKENEEFQDTVADQRATQKLLAIALKVLADFYKHQALVQTNQKTLAGQAPPPGGAPPPGFRQYEKNAASGGVMGMMQGIIDDAKAMEVECVHAEETAQKDYEDFTKDTRTSIEKKTTDIETKSEDKAKAEQDLAQANRDLDATLTEIENLINEEHALHKECDFLLKNFETSQAARSAEIESLKQANQIFSGASFAFLQSHAAN